MSHQALYDDQGVCFICLGPSVTLKASPAAFGDFGKLVIAMGWLATSQQHSLETGPAARRRLIYGCRVSRKRERSHQLSLCWCQIALSGYRSARETGVQC